MNQKVLKTLEYNKIIDMLTEKADSEPGKRLCRKHWLHQRTFP